MSGPWAGTWSPDWKPHRSEEAVFQRPKRRRSLPLGRRARGRRSGNRRVASSPAIRAEVAAAGLPWWRRVPLRPLVGLLAGGLLLVAGALAALIFVTRSAYFRVRAYSFSPTVHVTAQELRRFAGLQTGNNIFSVDLEAVAERVAAHPWVASARAVRRLPGRIHLEIKERQAAAAVLMGNLYLVDPTGVVFKRAEPAEAHGLVVITGVNRGDYEARRPEARRLLRLGLEVLALYKSGSHRLPLGEIHLDGSGAVTLYTRRRGTQIRLGRSGFLAKLRRLDVLLTALGKDATRLQVVHLDNDVRPDRVTVRLAEGSDGST